MRALSHAGATAILASLWKVNDERAMTFMESFYLKAQSMTLARALSETQREMMKTAGSHPYYWAPFILVGNFH